METPISRAAHNGHLHAVQFLAEKGADVNCLDLVSFLFDGSAAQALMAHHHQSVRSAR